MTLDEYRLRFRSNPGARSLKRELLSMLRDIDDAIDDALVEPLCVAFQLRAKGTLTWERARDVARMLRGMTAEELNDMRAMLVDGLAATPSDPIVFYNRRKLSEGDREGIAVTLNGEGRLIEGRAHAEPVMRALRNAGLGRLAASTVGISTRPGHEHGDDDTLLMYRADIEVVLRIVGRY